MMNFIAQNIKFLRSRLHINQTVLAEKLELNRGKIASYELGKAEPNISNLTKLARFFKIDLADLIEIQLTESYFINQDINPVSIGNHDLQLGRLSEDKLEFLPVYIDYFAEVKKIAEGYRALHKRKYKDKSILDDSLKPIIYNYEDLLELIDEIIEKQEIFLKELQDAKEV